MSWRLNYAVLNEIAAEAWDLRWPVEWMRRHYLGVIRWAGHTVAYQEAFPSGQILLRTHRIRFPGNMGHTFALKCIAHELEHAAQNERVGIFTFEYLYLTDKAGYERMAGEAEKRWRELLPAVRGAT